MSKKLHRSKTTDPAAKPYNTQEPQATHPNKPGNADEQRNGHVPSRGEHHCPYNGAKPHTLHLRICLKKKHVGYCGICGILCCYRAGCMHHRSVYAKGENTFTEDTQELRDIVVRNKALSILRPGCSVPYVIENGKVVLLDKLSDTRLEDDIYESSLRDIFVGMDGLDDIDSESDTSLLWN